MSSSHIQVDKFELHFRQQLSALMDGDLAPDEARFLLRRLQHDGELNSQWERWQLLADVLRGQAAAPAPAGFAERVNAAIAAETTVATTASAGVARSRGSLLRWGGGALAASFAVAAVTLFALRQQLPEVEEAAAPSLAVAPAPAVTRDPPAKAVAVEEAPATRTLAEAAAVAAVATPPVAAAPRRSATRTQQVARVAAANRTPVRAQARRATAVETVPAEIPVLAANTVPQQEAAGDPFASASRDAHAPAARPWPRSTLPGYSSAGAFNARYGGAAETVTAGPFYPFEPQPLPETPLSQRPPLELPSQAQE